MKKNEKFILFVCVLVIAMGFVLVFGKSLLNINFSDNSEEITIVDDSSKIEVVDSSEMPAATGTTEEITAGLRVEQTFINEKDSVSQLAIVFNKAEWHSHSDGVKVTIQLYCEGQELANVTVNTQEIEDQHRYYVDLNQTYTGMLGKTMTLVILGEEKDTGLCLMIQENSVDTIFFGSSKINGTICFTLN